MTEVRSRASLNAKWFALRSTRGESLIAHQDRSKANCFGPFSFSAGGSVWAGLDFRGVLWYSSDRMKSRSTTRKIGTVTLSLILAIAAIAAFLFANAVPVASAETAPVTDLVTEIEGDMTKAAFAEHIANGDGGYCEIAGDYFGDVTTSLWRRRYVVESESWEETLLTDGDLLTAGKYRYRLNWTADGGYTAGASESALLVIGGAY